MISSLHRALVSFTAIALVIGAPAAYLGHSQAAKYEAEWMTRSEASAAQQDHCMDAVKKLSDTAVCLQTATHAIRTDAEMSAKQSQGQNTYAFGVLCVLLGFAVWPVALAARWVAFGRPQIPSDRAIFEVIYSKYLAEYLKDVANQTPRRVYLPVNLTAIAQQLGCNVHILFGRFYSDLRQRYNADRREGFSHSIFEPKAGPDRHCVNFPYLVAILAGMREEAQRQWLTWTLSLLALAVSAFSLLVNLSK